VTWLAAELWPYLVLSGVLGFVVTVLMSVRRLKVRRVVVPVAQVAVVAAEEAAAVPEPAPAPPEAVGVAAEPVASPFPVVPGLGERPWEAEEEWSRPVRAVPGRHVPVTSAGVGSPNGGSSPESDWDDAAASWRAWAEEATGRRQQPDHGEPSYGAPASVEPVESPFPPGAIDTPFRYDDAPFPHAQPVEAPGAFPYAQPVEAFRTADRDAERHARLAELEAERLARLEAERLEAERRARVEGGGLEAERMEAGRQEGVEL
jgi:hypothetical protein